MFRIRRIHDDVLPVNREAIAQVQEILREPVRRRCPADDRRPARAAARTRSQQRFRALLFVADDRQGRVQGFALVLARAATCGFCFLDYIAAGQRLTGRGVGGALYERVREEARDARRDRGCFFECLPDDPEASASDPKLRGQNAARLRFYERFGARPIVGHRLRGAAHAGRPRHAATWSSTTSAADAPPAPRLRRAGRPRDPRAQVRPTSARRSTSSAVVGVVPRRSGAACARRATRKAPAAARPPASLAGRDRDRPGRQRRARHPPRARARLRRGAGARSRAILQELERDAACSSGPSRGTLAGRRIRAGPRRRASCDYLQARAARACRQGKSVYPYVFPIRNASPPAQGAADARRLLLHRHLHAAQPQRLSWPRGGAVDCALTAAEALRRAARLAYALVRPPGHHAERRVFGGFCYFNNTADRRPLPRAPRPGRDPRHRLPPRQRPAGHLLRARATC